MRRLLIGLSFCLSLVAQSVVYEDFSSVRLADGLTTLTCPASTWRGTWSAGTTYAQCDVVFYTGGPPSIFISRANSNTGHTPPASAANAFGTYWAAPLYPLFLSENSAQEYTVTNNAAGTVNIKLNATGASGHYLYLLKRPMVTSNYTFNGSYGASPYLQSWIKSGAWDAGLNRLTFKFQCDAALAFTGDGEFLEIGTYVRPHDYADAAQQGQHYYHFLAPNVYVGNWVYVTLNRRPEHRVGANPSTFSRYDDPEYTAPTFGSPVHYFDGLTDVYFDWVYNQLSGATCKIADIRLSTATGETDGLTRTNTAGATQGYIGTVSALYSGPISGYTYGRYEVVWQSPTLITGGQQYNIRYGTTDLHTAGFSSGTNGGTSTGPSGTTYSTVRWFSPDMPQSSGAMYVAIQPVGQTAFNQVSIPGTGLTPGNGASPTKVKLHIR